LRDVTSEKLYEVVSKGPVKQPFRHKVFIKTFKVSFRQTTLIERHHPTTGHPWHRLLRLYLLKCHLQLVIDGRRHLLRL
jgi:hypothetical protein